MIIICNRTIFFQLAVLQENPKDKIAGRITDFYNHCSAKNVNIYLFDI